MQEKVARLGWAKPGDKGQHVMIPINDLLIDHEYQRNVTNDHNILDIASNFDWSGFGNLIVMRRTDGKLYVVDGQQRLAAVRKRGDIEKVPCLLFLSAGVKQEAKAFLIGNYHRKPVTAIVKFRASLLAGEEPEITIGTWLGENDFRVAADANIRNVIDFPTKIIFTWKRDSDACKEAILVQREISAGMDKMNGHIHAGIWWLIRKGVNVRKEIPTIANAGGRARIIQQIRKYQIESGQPEASAQTCGMGILAIINYRRRSHKIKIVNMD